MTEAEIKATQRIFVNNCLAMLGIENLGFTSLGMGIFLFAGAVSWVKKSPFLVSWNNLFCLFIHLFLQMRNVPKEKTMKNIENCEVTPRPLFE